MSRGVYHLAQARRDRRPRRKSRLEGKSPRYLLSVLTHMATMADALPKRELQAHGNRALRRAAKRRRYAANTRRLERNGWRAFHEEEKRRARAEA